MDYPTDQLPLSYVPGLFGIQFTEPAVILFICGIIVFFYQIWKRTIKPDLAVVTGLWGLLPLTAFTIFRPSLYDNIRQILFLTPALFLIIGLTLDQLVPYIRKPALIFAGLLVLIIPGIYAIVHLYPYEYVYYNSFSGGTQSAYKKFEGDYLATSFREGMEYLNQTATQNSRVIIYGPSDENSAAHFARPDLYVDNVSGTSYGLSSYQYAIISTRNDRDSKKFTDWQTLYVIQRDNNIFALVKQKP
jgi:hypothetical protein